VTPNPPKVKYVGQILGRGYYAIAFHKKDDALADEIDAALDRLSRKGTLFEIYKKWQLLTDSQDEFLPQGVFQELEPLPDTGPAEEEAKGYFWLLVKGAEMTVRITVLSFLLAVLIALPIALCRLYAPAPLNWLAMLYVEFFRGIPVLLLLVFLYFGLPAISEYYGLGITLKLNAFQAAVLGFGLNYAAYEAEIYRAGIGAIPPGQWGRPRR
jgi:polar amino acid transport system substrate-binding protein